MSREQRQKREADLIDNILQEWKEIHQMVKAYPELLELPKINLTAYGDAKTVRYEPNAVGRFSINREIVGCHGLEQSLGEVGLRKFLRMTIIRKERIKKIVDDWEKSPKDLHPEIKIKKVLVIINRTKKHAAEVEKNLKQIFNRAGVKQEWQESLPPGPNLQKQMENRRNKKACLCDHDVDLVVAVGGDGTVLQAAHRIGRKPIPILGINIGFLGFITAFQENGLKTKLRTILKGEFTRSVRTTLDVSVRNSITGRTSKAWALNDVLITRGGNPHMIAIKTLAGIGNLRTLNTYRCDGLILATPTGSTAYSLSAGGPIISPDCNMTVITPICPHSLTNRSVVISGNEKLQLSLEENSGAADLLVDGMKIQTVHPNDQIEINTSEKTVHLAFLQEINYYETLASKLNWRGDGVSRPKYGA